ncbi:MAG: hypothetical protein CVU84_12470 [Firmicutes bacterium HGW-Firmicutes-1]|jgi:hypothetical protein|nr:MAG: hypothetical protein CVU84_12470 [Firmicutes bacterium HGW-Firmicutes-1]
MKLSSDKKKELQEKYKQMKFDMGLFAIINKSNSKHYLETSQDVKALINRREFTLKMGMHPNKELQKDWQQIGQDGFEIKILEQLEYDEDDSKTDYSDELELLKMIWIERLIKENIEMY